jgi:hypothetical protein
MYACTLADNESTPLASSKRYTLETASEKSTSTRRRVPLCDANDVAKPKVPYTYESRNGWICRYVHTAGCIDALGLDGYN